MTGIRLILIFLSFLPVACIRVRPVATRPDLSSVSINWGNHLARRGEYDKAIAEFNQCIRDYPPHAAAFEGRGYAHHRNGGLDRAIADYTEAIRLDPTGSNAYLNRGIAHAGKGAYELAIADCTEAIRRAPASANAFVARADARKGRANALQSERPRIRLPGGQSFTDGSPVTEAEELFAQAISDYTQALRLDPHSVTALTGRASVWFLQDRLDQAAADYSRVLDREPQNAEALFGRGQVQFFQNDFARAVETLTQALELNGLSDSDRMVAVSNLGSVYVQQGRYDRAVALYTRAMARSPSSKSWLLTQRARAWKQQGDFTKAVEDLTEFLAENPQDTQALKGRASVWECVGEYGRAAEDYTPRG